MDIESKNKNTFLMENELSIFVTDEDKYGQDITKMSNFFSEYVNQKSSTLKKSSKFETINDFSIISASILSEIIQNACARLEKNITLLPDFDALPPDIKEKLKKGIYHIGESKQVDENLRPVILNEKGTRVKDLTLKKIIQEPNNMETILNISNQLQMYQIYQKLSDIYELQLLQLEKDRDRDMTVPFFDARSLILEAENAKDKDYKLAMLKKADDKLRLALNTIYQDIRSTTNYLVKLTDRKFLMKNINKINTQINFLTMDFQLITKYLAIRMQLLEYIGEEKMAKEVFNQYQHTMYNFLTKPVNKKGLSTVQLIHNYFTYDKSNLNCWIDFEESIKPKLEASINSLETGESNIYLISMEDCNYEE